MSTLANHAFIKMNGLGNEIVVVDMRGEKGTISAAEARAVAQPQGARAAAPYDQLMVLHAPRTPGTRWMQSQPAVSTGHPAGSAAAPAARCKNVRRGSLI